MTGLVERYPDLTAAGLTFLELASVEEASLKQYVQQLGLFCDWRHTWPEAEARPAEIDLEIAKWMNVEYAKGHKPWRGEKLVASLMALAPTCSRHGTIKLARSFRALKGWKKRCPVTSKKPWAWPIWAMVATEMVRNGYRRAAIGTLIMVACYLRPREAILLSCGGLLEPTEHVVAA